MEGNNNIFSTVVVSNDNLSTKIKVSNSTNLASFYEQIIKQFYKNNNNNINLKLFYFEGYSHKIYFIKEIGEYVIANKKGIEYFYLSNDDYDNNSLYNEERENIYYMKYHSVILFSPIKILNTQFQNNQRKKMQIENIAPRINNSFNQNPNNNFGNQNFMMNNNNGFNNMMNMNNNMMMNNNFNINNFMMNNPMAFMNNNQGNFNNIDNININNFVNNLRYLYQINPMMAQQLMLNLNPMFLSKCILMMQEKLIGGNNFINNNNINNNINNNMINNSIPEYETIDTETNPLNKYIENAINISYTMKLDILKKQKFYKNLFINIAQVLNSPGFLSGQNSINDDYRYILCLIGKILENHGIIVGIYKENNMKDRIDLSAIQFIFSGLINKKKYKLGFSINKEKVNKIYDLSQRKIFIEKWKGIIANKLNINQNLIILTNIRDGGGKKLFLDLAFNPNVGIFEENYIKNRLIQGELISCQMLPLLEACRLSPSIFDQRYHKFYNFPKNNLRRGGEQYIQPLSWAAYGINVQGKYDFGDNTWLGNKNKNGEFAVAYYGINNLFNQNMNNIQSLLSLMGNQETGRTFININNLRNPGQTCQTGAYFYKNPNHAENSSDAINIGGYQYKIMFMCRVNPSRIRQPENFKDCWILSPTSDEVRPYKILIKQIVSQLVNPNQYEIKMCFEPSPSKSYLQILENKDESYFNFNNANFFFILRDYTGGGYSINDYLRNNYLNLNNPQSNSYVWCLHKAITQSISNVPNGTVVYRGVNIQIPANIGIGNKFFFREFLSTSKDLNMAKSFSHGGTLMVITILNNNVNGKKNYCLDIEQISAFPFEREIIFTSHCQFRVTNIENNILYLTCEGLNF